MTTATIRKKLIDYMQTADDKKVKAVYSFVESEIEQEETNAWNDEEFLSELDRRHADYMNDKSKGISWEVAKQQVLSSSNSTKTFYTIP
jgi:hypothetical protein